MNQEELARQLNYNMVDLLLQRGQIRSPAIEKAFRAVLRHALLPPDVNVAEIYQDKTIILKEATADAALPVGTPLSSSTMPGLLAAILEASEIQPGMRVLQIGTGPGYLAALIGHLVTDSGTLTTIEIDNDIAEKARVRLSTSGYRNIHCVVADGYLGYPHMAPYNRIIVTASCADVPQTWIDQLDQKGLLILPFSLSQRASLYPMIAFEKDGERLIGKVASSLIGVGFIPLYGQHVTYWVLYEKAISKLETATYLHLQKSTHRGGEYKGIAMVALLEIAKVVEDNPHGFESIDPMRLSEKSTDLWKLLGRPKVGDFAFHLLPKEQTIENYRWRFNKDEHNMFVGIRHQA